ncbi:MAG: 2-oxoacid:acceptor oxidoreductase family protein [Thermoplasmata archaeon]|nr:2-oxoacid:acceptor oxidoreductase family protein [Thermoplasmata archaeon]
MIEIRFHGRGGQGAVIASRLLAEAAFIEGKDVQAFPFFGVERRGAPVTAFTKIDDRPIRIKSEIYEPDHVIVLDTALLGYIDVVQGLKPGGRVLINCPLERAAQYRARSKAPIDAVDGTGIAIGHGLGSRESPIVNTSMLGAFARSSGLVGIDAVAEAIRRQVRRKVEANIEAARDAHDRVDTMEG